MSIPIGPLSTLPTSVAALGNAVLSVAQLLDKNVVGIQPQSAPITSGLPPVAQNNAFIFNFEGEQTVTLDSDITNHFIENNSAIQDQVSLKPEMITTHGYIAELNDILPSILQPLQAAAQSVTIISGYSPTLSVSALIALNQAVLAYNSVAALANTGVAAISSLLGSKSQNKQQDAFNTFYGYWQKRTLFTVQTPWNVFVNCAIKSLRAIQDSETQLVSDFEITFQVLKFSQTIYAGDIQIGQNYVNNYIAQNTPLSLGSSTPTNTGASLTGNISKLGVA